MRYIGTMSSSKKTDASADSNTTPDTSVAAANAAAASFARLTSKLNYLSATDLDSVKKAYRFADEAHLGQVRHSGEPFITHPIAVAALCAEWKLDTQALIAALLHDAMEDCAVKKSDLVAKFGMSVADLVDGLTKIDKLHFNTREENQAESFRKMLLAMARDVRIILIKLADRTHNMRTLSGAPREKWHRIASETLDIYVPIAHRLGLNQTYLELQDLSFKHLQPWRYNVLVDAVNRARHNRRNLFHKVQTDLQAAFLEQCINVKIAGREKSIYSIYKKMREKHMSFAQVTDIFGFRIIVPHLMDCYTAMGLLHQLYKPVLGKFKDHIAIQKNNGYQSLHTILVGPSGVNMEFQLRTDAMHLVAESGVASHWLYKGTGSVLATQQDQMDTKWLQSLLEIGNAAQDAAEFWEHIKVGLFTEAIYVFTPKSQIIALPRGSTVIDFAYAIHSNVGDQAVAVKINGEHVPLRTELGNGDVIEIKTNALSSPNPGWLGFVRTARARTKIRQYLKTLNQADSQKLGQKMLAQALRIEGFDHVPDDQGIHATIWEKLLHFSGNKTNADLLTEIGVGRRIASIVAKRLAKLLEDSGERPDALLLSCERFANGDTVSQGNVTIDGSENTSVRFAICCRPIPGDGILGYLGRGECLVIHTKGCHVAHKLQHKEGDRFIPVEWSDEPVRSFETSIVVTVHNNKGVFAKVATSLAAAEADINHVDMTDTTTHATVNMTFVISVRDRLQLDTVFKNLRHTACVVSARRNNNAL